MTKCQYKYKHIKKKKCPHEALDGKNVCYWHEERNNKDPEEELQSEDFKDLDLTEANLQEAFLVGVNFQRANLYLANLQEAFLDLANLQEAFLAFADFQRAHLCGANLQEANLHLANLQEANLYLVKFDDSNLWQAKLDEIVTSEREESYDEASQIYRNLKNYFRNEGIYEKSGHYYYREKVVEKKIYRQKNKGKYFGSLLLDLLCGYGEKPGRIIYSALTVIIISAILYYGVGIEAYVIEGSSFQVVKISYSSQFTVHENLENLVTCSYFSVVTFTTLGYGDFHPVGASRTIAMVEAFMGVFMLALFVLTMGRKMMR
ncbi:MAG: pentapeptide repeat-containing protein [Theionarchaea archaeon]|nr:pentapeptide repeat-containing protein [Theionarchaea archaeon]